MKRVILLLCLVLGLSVLGGVTALYIATADEGEQSAEQTTQTLEETTDSEEIDWIAWFKEEAMPVVIAVGFAVVTLLSTWLPSLVEMLKGLKMFKSSSGTFASVTEKVLETQIGITEFKDTAMVKLDEVLAKYEGKFAEYESKITELKKVADALLEIVKIGFGNNTELVRNGFATEILKVGVESGSETEKENSTADDK